MQFTIALEEEPGGGFVAQCVELPGAISQGETEEEALANIQEAILLVLEARHEDAKRRHARLQTVEVDADTAVPARDGLSAST